MVFWKAIGNDVDTAYTHLTTKSYEGKSAQILEIRLKIIGI